MDEFDSISEAFLSWLSRSRTSINPGTDIADLRQQIVGRGVATPEFFYSGFSIDRGILLLE